MKTTKNRLGDHFLALSCLFAVLGLAGCDQKGSEEKTSGKVERTTENTAPATPGSADRPAQPMQGAQQPSTQKSETIGGTIDDTAITTKVKAALLNDPSLSASRIDVTTDQGVVKLTGTVDSEQGANKARALATAQPGVKSVQSDLSVTTAPGK